MRSGTRHVVSNSRLAGLAVRSAIGCVVALLSVLALPAGALAQHPLMLLPLGDPAYTQLAALERMGCASARVSPHRPYTVEAIRRALGETRSDPMCLGPIEEALLARFIPAARPSVRALDTTGVASDLAAAAAAAAEAVERAPRARIDTTERLRIGALATVRAVSLSKDEFRPLWLDVRADSAGQPIAVGILRARLSYAAGPRFLAVSEAYGQTSARNDPLVRGRLFRRTSGVLDFSEAYLTGRAGPLTLSFVRALEACLVEGEE